MTSKFWRKRVKQLKSVFPCTHFKRRLKTVENAHDLGVFALDKITVVVHQHVTEKDCMGISLGAIRDNDGGRQGFTHRFLYKSHEYQFFQDRGRNRCFHFNPRLGFTNFSSFTDYVQEVIGKREYHITRVDFAFYLKKTLFSVDFLFWSAWVSGIGIKDVRPKAYLNPIVGRLNRSRLQSLEIGHMPTAYCIYDCDAHNLNKNRAQSSEVNGMINMEVQHRTAALRRLGICSLTDLKQINFMHVLEKIEFYEPSVAAIKNTKFESYKDTWMQKGLIHFARQAHQQTHDHDQLRSVLNPVQVGRQSLKHALAELSQREHDAFIKGNVNERRFGIKSVAYEYLRMPPLFALP